MGRDWESTFRAWSKPSSDTEEQKCENAQRMIKSAIDESDLFTGNSVRIITQGSYRNNTNVKQDSDVDICICSQDCFYYHLSDDLTINKVGIIVPGPYNFANYKNWVHSALVDKFGRDSITRGNKAFDVHANSFRVDADVIAAFEYRHYTGRYIDNQFDYCPGIRFVTDRGDIITNWPDQNYDNGVRKNTLTGNRYKFITRIIKRLRNEMADNGISQARPIPSFLIECLIWNVPNDQFQNPFYSDDVRNSLRFLILNTLLDKNCHEWGEVNEWKYLFRPSQPWTRQQTNEFLLAAWNYIGFK